MIQLYRQYLNDGNPIDEQIRKGFYSDDFIGVKCVDEDGSIVGVFTAFKGVAFTCGHEDLVDYFQTRYPEASIYTAEMIVVLPKWRHLGIAQLLVEAFNTKLRETDATYLLIELWREPTGRIPGRVVLGIIGGEVEHLYKPHFYDDLESYGLTCPICGRTCKCGADICLLELESQSYKTRDTGKEEDRKRTERAPKIGKTIII